MMVVKKVCFVGAGYVGGSSSAVTAFKCPDLNVDVVDLSQKRIDQWNSDDLPIDEPGLQELVKSCRNRNLTFSTEIGRAVDKADLIFLCVNTPTKESGRGEGLACDLQYLESAVHKIARICSTSKIVVNRSTVPVGTLGFIYDILMTNGKPGVQYSVLSNPEFLITGRAVEDCLNPDRVLIGYTETLESQSAASALSWIYEHWVPAEKIITMASFSSELTKLASNALAAQRYSSVNALSTICERVGADINEVTRGLEFNPITIPKGLKAKLGFGGSCLQKDVLQLVYMCECLDLPEVATYWRQVVDLNEFQKMRSSRRVKDCLGNCLQGKTLAIFGFAFKQGTSDTRDSPAISVCRYLIKEGAHLRIYDPAAKATQILEDLAGSDGITTLAETVSVCPDPYSSSEKCHALVVCTEWEEFKYLDYPRIFSTMMEPAHVFDGCDILNHSQLIKTGFRVETVGVNLSEVSDRELVKRFSYILL